MKRPWWDASSERRASAPGAPFKTSDVVQIVLPARLEHLNDQERNVLHGLRNLLQENVEGLQLELGAPFAFAQEDAQDDPGHGPRFYIGPTSCNPALERLRLPPRVGPVLHVLREASILIADAPTVDGIFESLSLLKTMHWDGATTLTSEDCQSVTDAVTRIVWEVPQTWPSLHRHRVDWEALCERYADRVLAADDPAPLMEQWLAELGDAHTGVRAVPGASAPSFRARVVGSEVVLHDVWPGSAAWEAGAREGFVLNDIDVSERWSRVGAAPHHKPFLVALRATSAAAGASRAFTARSTEGHRVSWIETYAHSPSEPISWRRLKSGSGYLRIAQWVGGSTHAAAIDAAFEDLRGAPGLIVDLRGNGGGSVGMARAFRARFLSKRTLMGYRQFSDPWGELGKLVEMYAEPAPIEQRWQGPVRFLTDPLTYSASEDALLGLSGLEHVEVIGLESGGGSGQARTVRLQPGWRLMVSSCLTFDRDGGCVEGQGIRVDRRVPLSAHRASSWNGAVLSIADRDW
jgi:carboxyl-terminal processing protease